MNEAVVNPGGLSRRSGALALLLTFFLPVVGFAYVRRMAWGFVFVAIAPLLMLVGGRLGLPASLLGYYGLLALLTLAAIAALVLAFRFARAMPVGTPPRWYNRWYHYVWLAIASVVLGNWLFADWFVRHRGEVFGYETYRIPSTSMQPTLRLGDFVTVDARSGERTALRRGEIVTYVPAEHPEQMWIARIIGLPGETIVTRDNRAAIDGNVLDEPYIQIEGNPIPVEAIPFPSAKLGSDEVYLMGDNRLNAADSRFQGPVPVSALRGKVKAIWFSYSPITHTIETGRIGSLSAVHAR